MNVLDENIPVEERKRLRSLRIHTRQIGAEVGWHGMKDRNEVIPLLHSLQKPTFFTRDHDFYKPFLRHPEYCLVLLDVDFDKTAEYIRRVLRHKDFRTQSKRMGKLIRAHREGISFWQIGYAKERRSEWHENGPLS